MIFRIFEVPGDEGIPLARFLFVVGQLKFRGTSVLFRLPRSPVLKTARTQQTRVRELSPGPGVVTSLSGVATPISGVATPTPGDQLKEQEDKSPKTEKKVSFAGLGPTVKEEEDGKGGMEVGRGREEVDGGNREGEETMNIDPNETLPAGMPAVRVRGEDDSEEDAALGALSGLEGDGFSIATHFVKVSSSQRSRIFFLQLFGTHSKVTVLKGNRPHCYISQSVLGAISLHSPAIVQVLRIVSWHVLPSILLQKV